MSRSGTSRAGKWPPESIADVLVADGLGTYQANPHHQRAKLLQLTQTGQAALHAIDAAQHRWCDALGHTIGATTLQRTAAALRQITDAVENARP